MPNSFLTRPRPFDIVQTGNQTATGPSTNLNSDRLAKSWRASGAGQIYVVVDLLSVIEIDTVALLAHNLTASDTIRIRTADTSAPLLGATAPGPFKVDQTISAFASSDASNVFHKNALGVVPLHTARYLRIDISTSIANFYAGRLVINRSAIPATDIDFGYSYSIIDLGSKEKTPNGIDDITLSSKVARFNCTWSWITEAEARAELLRIFSYAGVTKSVLFVLRPDEPQLHNFIGYGKFDNEAPFVYESDGMYNVQISLTSDLIREY